MSKRNTKDSPGSLFYSPAKKKKLNITVESLPKTNSRQSMNKKQEFDPWGADDFLNDEDLLELDNVESQAYSQEVNISQDESLREIPAVPAKPSPKPSTNWPQVPSFGKKSHNPSPNKVTIFAKPSTSNSANHKFLKPDKLPVKESVKSYQEKKPSQLTSSFKNGIFLNPNALSNGIENTSVSTQGTDFANFENDLLQENNMNSTFRLQKPVVVVPDDSHREKLRELEEENKKLLNELMTKEGEKVFLRKQQTTMQQKLNEEKLAKSKMLEELQTKHRAELLAIRKEKEEAVTKFGLQALEVNKWMAHCKILEKGSVKLVEAHVVNTDSGHRNRINTTINRAGPPAKKIKVKEIGIQAEVFHKSIHKLKSSVSSNPLEGIPECIFKTSEPEKPIVDIHMVEKIGKMNLPICQDEETIRIFENPKLVKPIVTIVDSRQLSVQFFLPSLTGLLNKTREEINSTEIVPTINRIVATTRELILNTLTSLRKILNAMKNDDVRDMNDLYHSDSYKIPVSHAESIWDAKRWHEKERGIETRRSLAVLSYIVMSSTYLSEYITGKSRLKVEEDVAYGNYSLQLRTYNSWTNKDCDFEFLELILEFITVIGLARRSHNFSGVINAIVLTLSNTQKAAGFCSTGLDYVFQIFREIVFSRPLLVCFKSISEMMMTFGGCARFSEKLCVGARSAVHSSSNGTWYFKPDPKTCVVEIYLRQMQSFADVDPITVIKIAHAIVSFMQTTLPMNAMPWKEEYRDSCKCCGQLIIFTVKTLCESSRLNIDELETKSRKSSTSSVYSRILDGDFWEKLKSKQQDIMIRGIRFLSYLLIREPDYVLRRTDMENAFYLLIDCVKNSKNLKLHENEREILERLGILDRINSENSSRNSEGVIKYAVKTQVAEAPEKEWLLPGIHKLRRDCFNL